jgi:hypothetical protein
MSLSGPPEEFPIQVPAAAGWDTGIATRRQFPVVIWA